MARPAHGPDDVVRRALAWLVLCCTAACGLFGGPYVAKDEKQQPIGVPIDVAFVGADHVSEGRLLRKIEDRLFDLSREPESLAIVEDAKFDIEDAFRQEGFPDVVVVASVERLEDPKQPELRRVTFTITENDRVTVRNLRVIGADMFTREKLRSFWLQHASGALGLGDPYYVETDVLGLVQSLRLFLLGEGYLGCEVELASVLRSATEPVVDIVVQIHEREPYLVGAIEIAPAIRDALGDVDLALPTGELAAARRIDDLRTRIRQELRKRGRPEPQIHLELGRDTDAHRVTVQVGGDPGRRAVVDEVRIRGLVQTKESVVRELFDFGHGDAYDGAAVDDALRDLYLTGLFQRVDVTLAWLDQPTDDDVPGHVAIQLDIEELESRTVEALVGWGSYERARAKLRFEEANLFGTGRGLVVEGRISQKGWRTLASVTDRNFLKTRVRASVTGDALEREEPSFIDRAYGGTVAFARDLTDEWTTRVGYSYRPHTGLQNDVIDPAASITSYIEASPFVESRFDSRDSPIYPRSGLQVSMQADANDPAVGSDIQFGRVRFGASYAIPFSDRAGIVLRTDQGWLWPGDGSDQVPLQERFYNGGENSVRSFRQSELGPLDPNGKPVGGEYRNTFNVEFRSRLVRTLEGALFADAGNVGADVRDFGFSDMRYGLGLGLRLALPIGPIRVDGAWNPDRRANEDNWVVHLSVGYPF